MSLPLVFYFLNSLKKMQLILKFCVDHPYLHSSDRVGPQLPVILHGDVPPLLKFKAGVDSELLPSRFAEGFGPFGFAWVFLLFEIFVAF